MLAVNLSNMKHAWAWVLLYVVQMVLQHENRVFVLTQKPYLLQL